MSQSCAIPGVPFTATGSSVRSPPKCGECDEILLGRTDGARSYRLMFLVLPAFLLLTVVPVLITTVQSIR
jgi:hypothetical protein